jgi:hypothetical protein
MFYQTLTQACRQLVPCFHSDLWPVHTGQGLRPLPKCVCWRSVGKRYAAFVTGCVRRYMPVQKVAWQDVKGTQVLMGSYEEAVKARAPHQHAHPPTTLHDIARP